MTMFYSDESQLGDNQASIEAFWQQKVTAGSLTFSEIELANAYVLAPNATQAVVISSGRIECFLKYKELIWELYNNDYAVFIVDHPGQGLSSRQLNNSHKGFIEDFAVYVDAFAYFIEKVVNPCWSGPKIMLAHSMGSAIAALYLKTNAQAFQKAIFCAPMFGIHLGAPPQWLAEGLVNTLYALGLKTTYLPGQSNYNPKPFDQNQLTGSEVRYQHFRALYHTVPELQLGGVTIAWLKAAFTATKEIANTTLDLEILLLQAADDEIVDNQAQNIWVTRQTHTTLVCFEAAKHELLCEQDKVRRPVMSHIYDFLAARTTDSGS